MKKFISILLVCMMTLTLAACGSKEERGVSTDGSTSMQKVMLALGEAFMENNSGTNFTYNGTGSGSGIKAVKQEYTIIMVTHNMQQAVRISDNTAFFLLGELVEYGETDKVFPMPRDKRTEDYITGKFG